MSNPPPITRPPALPPALAHRTGILLYKVAQFVQDHLDAALQPWGLKTRHYKVLSVLAYRAPLSQQALVEKLRIDRAMMVDIVDELERQGLVERQRNQTDRRLYDLTPTDVGRAMVTEMNATLDAMEAAVFAPLSEAEQQHLHALLARLLAPTE